MASSALTESSLFPASVSSGVHFLASGSFTSALLYVLSWTPSLSLLSVVANIPAKGPHQYLALNKKRDVVYATSWALPSELSAWKVIAGNETVGGVVGLEEINSAPITATSSYIAVNYPFIYSAGGPTGEVHTMSASTEGFEEKIQEVLFVPEEELEAADKTKAALRYGSHAVELCAGKAYIPVLGTNSINVYAVETTKGTLTLLDEVKSPREGDGPRHCVCSADGKFVYSVTEHTSFVDVYSVTEKSLQYLESKSVLPPSVNPHDYRGDTIRFSVTSPYIFATTRGQTSSDLGYLTAFQLDTTTGLFVNEPITWQTPTWGGKANAIEVFPFEKTLEEQENRGEWIVLTDHSSEGLILIVEWDAENLEFRELARTVLKDSDGSNAGGSHAVWLQ